jgi:hypothetical protein
MSEDYISPVRPPFTLEEVPKKRCERLIAGSSVGGMFIDVCKDGIEVNAYYTGWQGDLKYAVLRDGIVIPWEEVEKIKNRVLKPTKEKTSVFDHMDDEVNIEYLKTLPIVHINKRRYYIDSMKRERRSVEKPEEVWRF